MSRIIASAKVYERQEYAARCTIVQTEEDGIENYRLIIWFRGDVGTTNFWHRGDHAWAAFMGFLEGAKPWTVIVGFGPAANLPTLAEKTAQETIVKKDRS